MKKILAIMAVAGTLLASSAVYAGWGDGWCISGNDQGVSGQKVRNFQRDALKLMEMQLDLQDELSMDVPDGKRIAILRKKIIGLQSQLQAASDKYGIGWRTSNSSGNHQMINVSCGCNMCGW